MTREEWRLFHNFSEETMKQIELALSISGGRITEIMSKPLEYQDIKITFKTLDK